MTVFSIVSYSTLEQETKIDFVPSVNIDEINSVSPSLNLYINSNLKDKNIGYYGNVNIKKIGISLIEKNLHYSKESEFRGLVGFKNKFFNIFSPYFEIAFYPMQKFEDKYESFQKYDFGTKIGFEIEKDRHLFDINAYYIGNLILYPSSISSEIKYKYDGIKFKTDNYLRIRNIFGEIYLPGFSNDYKDSFLYSYEKNRFKYAYNIVFDNSNEIKIRDDLSFGLGLNFEIINQNYKVMKKGVEKRKNNFSTSSTLFTKIKYENKNINFENKISNNILVSFSKDYENNKFVLDKYSEDDFISKKLFEFPENYNGSRPIINNFKIENKFDYNFTPIKNLNLKPKLSFNYNLKSIIDVDKNKVLNYHKIEVEPAFYLKYDINKLFSIENELSTNLQLLQKYENSFKKNIEIKNKFSFIYRW